MKHKIYLMMLLIAVIFISSCAPKPAGEVPTAEEKTTSETERDDFGCWPPSCSFIPDAQGQQLCTDWKAGKQVQWQDCNYFSNQPACVKLCEFEKKGTDGGKQKQAFNTLPSLVKAEFAGDVSQEDKNVITQGVAAMDFYLQKWFGKSTNKPSGLNVDADAPANEGEGAQVEVKNGVMNILLKTGSSPWKRQIQTNKEFGGEWRSRLAAHEYVHVYQFQNGCGSVSVEPPIVPKWFGEGEAEWLAYKAMIEAGQIPQLSIPQFATPQAKQVVGSLQSFENPTGLNFQAYFLYTMAVDYLMKDRSIKALDDFCANVGSGVHWSKAFETTFGITLPKFYEDFESYRKTWSSESSLIQN